MRSSFPAGGSSASPRKYHDSRRFTMFARHIPFSTTSPRRVP